MKQNIKISLLGLAILYLGACTQPDKTPEQTVSPQETKTASPASEQCYAYSSAGDTISLIIHKDGSAVTGKLVYKLKEKDMNSGSIKGSMHNNLLLADYTFNSEGTQSVRQVAFRMEGNYFMEGYGDFKHIDSLDFGQSFKLTEVDCH